MEEIRKKKYIVDSFGKETSFFYKNLSIKFVAQAREHQRSQIGKELKPLAGYCTIKRADLNTTFYAKRRNIKGYFLL